MAGPPGPHEITLAFARVKRGEPGASDALFEVVYGELRALAGAWFRNNADAPTLQPTALVHDVWIKLAASNAADAADRAHFFAVAARTMRQVLIDHVRARGAEKRGGARTRIELDAAVADSQVDALDVLALDDALRALEKQSPVTARVVEMRFFGGLSGDDTALALSISPRSVDREWRFARAWLAAELDGWHADPKRAG